MFAGLAAVKSAGHGEEGALLLQPSAGVGAVGFGEFGQGIVAAHAVHHVFQRGGIGRCVGEVFEAGQ